MPKMPSSLFLRYGSAVLALLLATLLRALIIDSHLGNDIPLLLYFVAVVVVVHYSGLGPATATLLGGALLASFLMPPPGVFWLTAPVYWIALALYLLAGLFIIRLTGALRQSEARYRELIDNLHEGIWLIDQDHNTTFVNARMADMLGYRTEEMLGKDLFAFMDEPARTVAERNLACGRQGVKADYEFEFRRKDGTPVVTRIATAPLFDEAGRYKGALAGVVDTTERKRLEEALQASEAELKEAQRVARLGSWEWDAKTDAVTWSEELYRLIGRDPTLPPPYWTDHVSLFTPESFGRLQAAVDEALRTGTTPYELDLEIVRPDGAHQWVSGRGEAKRDASGAIVGMRGTALDITARKQAEQALRASEARFRALFEQAGVGIAELDPEGGRLLSVNQKLADIGLYAPHELAGEAFLHFIHPDDQPAAAERFRALIRGGAGVYDLELRGMRKDGKVIWTQVNAVLVRLEAGRGGRVVCVIQDITDRKAAETALQQSEAKLREQAEQLAEADRRKDEFLATLAHELRNPLAPISNALQLLRRGGATTSPIILEQALGMGERQVSQLVRLVDDLLDISRISRGTVTLHKERVALEAVIRSALETARPPIEAAGHRLTVALPEAPTYLEADLTRLAQAVSNLLINAAKFTAPGGHIQLRAHCEGEEEVVIAVQDNGIGIPAEQLPKVFGLFAQVEQPLGQHRGGLGIGLALVRSLVELHGGWVEAASPGPGQGSTFTIRLPRGLAAPARASSEKVPATERPAVVLSRRILVVDDEVDVADSMAMLLQSCGHEVRAVYDGAAAITAAREYRPEVVLLDLGMPGLDGLEVARRLRALPELRGVRLIALTGWGQEEDRRRSRAAGFDDHLVKPVDLPTLEALLGGERPAAGTRQPTGG